MRKYWDKFVDVLVRVPDDKMLHFIFGALIAAFFALSLRMGVCIVPVIFFAFAKEFWDSWNDSSLFSFGDLVATLFGGVVIQLFVILGTLW